MALGVLLGDDSYVFNRDPEGLLPWRPDAVTQRWIRLRRRAGLGEVPLHGLCHFVATQLLSAGVDLRTVAGRLGHANPSVTMQVYAHFSPERDRRRPPRWTGSSIAPRYATWASGPSLR